MHHLLLHLGTAMSYVPSTVPDCLGDKSLPGLLPAYMWSVL